MQIRKSSMIGDRPSCPVDKKHKIHRHDTYERYGDCDDINPLILVILRFLCVPCGHTISVLPDNVLPYRAVPAPLVEKHFDAKSNDTPEPPANEKEKGCLKRAWNRFGQRVAALATVLGQMLQIRAQAPKPLWSALRQRGNLPAILLQLARPFNTSLLHDYLCIKPWRP
jgi:hypothetical protein